MPEEEDRRDGEGFFSAWSRRKRAAAQAEIADDTPLPADVEAARSEQHDAAPDPEPVISEEELAALPSLDEITGQTDLQPFMKRGVPEPLRKAAMRKVWLSNTLIAGHDDPAVDYAWDWNAAEGVPGAGGILEVDRVSKMVDDLINHERREPGATEPTEADGTADPLTAETSDQIRRPPSESRNAQARDPAAMGKGKRASETPSNPVRRDTPEAAAAATQSGETDTADPHTPEDELRHAAAAPSPIHRHGSAIPQ